MSRYGKQNSSDAEKHRDPLPPAPGGNGKRKGTRVMVMTSRHLIMEMEESVHHHDAGARS